MRNQLPEPVMLPFTPGDEDLGEKRLKQWINQIRENIKRDMDAVIVVTGREGSGKSTIAWHLANILDPDFNPDEQVAWSGKKLIEKGLKFTEKRNAREDGPIVIMLDEGVEGVFNRESMKTENKNLIKWLMISRERNLITILCFPRFANMDIYLREHRAHWWVYVDRQGLAYVHEPDVDPYEGTMEWQKWLWTNFDRVTGKKWERYKQKKRDYVSKMGYEAVEE